MFEELCEEVGAGLNYGGEVQRAVKEFSPIRGYLRQGKVCQRRQKDSKIVLFKLEFSGGQFLVQGFKVAQET